MDENQTEIPAKAPAKAKAKSKPKAPAKESSAAMTLKSDGDGFRVELTESLASQYNAIGEALQKTLGKKRNFRLLDIHYPLGMPMMSGEKNKFRGILERKFDLNPMMITYDASLPFRKVE